VGSAAGKALQAESLKHTTRLFSPSFNRYGSQIREHLHKIQCTDEHRDSMPSCHCRGYLDYHQIESSIHKHDTSIGIIVGIVMQSRFSFSWILVSPPSLSLLARRTADNNACKVPASRFLARDTHKKWYSAMQNSLSLRSTAGGSLSLAPVPMYTKQKACR
jgi:hypothetical protein